MVVFNQVEVAGSAATNSVVFTAGANSLSSGSGNKVVVQFWNGPSIPAGEVCSGSSPTACEQIPTTNTITVYPLPTVSVSPTSQTQAVGNTITLTATVNNPGSGVSAYQWYNGSLSNPVSGENTATYTATAGALGPFNYFVVATDTDGGTGQSNAGSVTVVPAPVVIPPVLLAITLSPTPDTITTSNSVAFTNVTTGGSGTFTYPGYLILQFGITAAPGNYTESGNSITFNNVGTYDVSEIVTDGANTVMSNNAMVTVNTPGTVITSTTAVPQQNNGGGGGGGGGGSNFLPTVLTSTSGGLVCSTIYNFTQHNNETIHVLNTTFKLTENYITPTTAGITIGNNTYELSPGGVLSLGTLNGINYTIELTSLSYLPIIDTVSVAICGTVPVALPALVVPANQTLVVTNVTTSGQSISGAYNASNYQWYLFKVNGLGVKVEVESNSSARVPENISITKYTGPVSISGDSLGALNITVTPPENITLVVTEAYTCNSDIQSIQPYVLKNGVWIAIKDFVVNTAACTVTYTVSGDPIVALIAVVSTPVTTAPVVVTNSAPSSSGSLVVWLVILLVAIALVALYAYARRSRRPYGDRKKR